jgi:hypothetical protein
VDVDGVAASLLTQFAEGLGALDTPTWPMPVPQRQYVAPGLLAWDGPGLCVTLGTAADQGVPGMPNSQSTPSVHALEFAATFYVQLTREVVSLDPEGTTADSMIPSAEALNDEGLQAMRDAVALKKVAVSIKKSGGVVLTTEGFIIGPVTTLGPQGNLAAVRIQVQVGPLGDDPLQSLPPGA